MRNMAARKTLNHALLALITLVVVGCGKPQQSARQNRVQNPTENENYLPEAPRPIEGERFRPVPQDSARQVLPTDSSGTPTVGEKDARVSKDDSKDGSHSAPTEASGTGLAQAGGTPIQAGKTETKTPSAAGAASAGAQLPPAVVTKPESQKLPPVETAKPNLPSTKPAAQPAIQPTPKTVPVTAKPAAKPNPGSTADAAHASFFMIEAYNVLVQEGKKIGTACNEYIQAVLKKLGFKKVPFLANDFDLAAKKIFSNYRSVKYTDPTEFKRHIWSYPEREGFILQWERPGQPHGHIAILERIGDRLFTYQASLSLYTARIRETTVKDLLAVNGNRGVIVYSDMVK